MKNFPNQFNDPVKFRVSLEAIMHLTAAEEDPDDDGVLGAELVRRGIYQLKGKGSLPQRLAQERRKPPSSQGTRTCARETRRTLTALGFLGSPSRLTRPGRNLLRAPSQGEEEKELWRRALLELQLGDDRGNVSHPVLVLLRLVEGVPIYHRDGTELALEARDDSRAEMRRVLRLAKLPSEQRRERIGVAKSTQDDARKIFPALAEHAGLIERQSRKDPYTLTQLGRLAVQSGRETSPGAMVVPERRRGSPKFSPPRRRKRGRRPARRKSRRKATPAELAAGEQLLYERTTRHEALLDRVTDCLAKVKDYEHSSSYDLVADPGEKRELVLFEIKTLEADEASQVRRAVGQLLFYENVVIPQHWPGRKALLAAVFEAAVSDYLADFLQSVRIGAIWCDASGLHAQNAVAKRIVKLLR